MVVTRSQFENLSENQLIDRLLQVENIEDKLEHLNNRFDNFVGKYNELHSELIELWNWKKMHFVQQGTLD